jgi:hypothetical protein
MSHVLLRCIAHDAAPRKYGKLFKELFKILSLLLFSGAEPGRLNEANE